MSYELIRAAADQIEIIVQHRRAMFAEMGVGTEASLAAMSAAYRPWLDQRIRDGSYVGFFVQVLPPDATAKIVAGGGVYISEVTTPGPEIVSGLNAHLVNVYTEPDHRRQGLARLVMTRLIEYSQSAGARQITLHASRWGRPLYESLGFKDNAEMRMLTSVEQN